MSRQRRHTRRKLHFFFIATAWLFIGLSVDMIIPENGRVPGGWVTIAAAMLVSIPIAGWLARKLSR